MEAEMNPNDIREFLAREFPQLVAHLRQNPDGWSFHVAGRRTGIRRILRVTQASLVSDTKILLSVSWHWGRHDVEREFQSSDELRTLVAEELRLYSEHFANEPT